MAAEAFTQSLPGFDRLPMASRRALVIVAVGLCAGAGLVAGAQSERTGAAPIPGPLDARSAGAALASGPQAIDAARRSLHALGIRDVRLCDERCAVGRPAVVGRIVADRAQAVIVSAPSADAAALVHDLRQAGSQAMVVLTVPADPAEVVRRLPGDERTWLATVVSGGAPGAGSMRLAIVGRHGSVLD